MSRTRIRGSLCFLIIFQACASGQAVNPVPQQAPQVDICSLIREPQMYDGRVVRVDAEARAGAHYEILLSGKSCSEAVVVLSIPKDLDDDESLARLRESVFKGFPGTTARAEATLVGRFKWHQDQVPARVLKLAEVVAVNTLHEN